MLIVVVELKELICEEQTRSWNFDLHILIFFSKFELILVLIVCMEHKMWLCWLLLYIVLVLKCYKK
jgi:hypothetical protein